MHSRIEHRSHRDKAFYMLKTYALSAAHVHTFKRGACCLHRIMQVYHIEIRIPMVWHELAATCEIVNVTATAASPSRTCSTSSRAPAAHGQRRRCGNGGTNTKSRGKCEALERNFQASRVVR